MRAVFVLGVATSVGLVLAACAGKVEIAAEDAAVDAVTDTAPTSTSTVDATPTTTSTAPTCPTNRPIRNIPCTIGLTCDYPCGGADPNVMRATCPSGRWVLTPLTPCGG